MLERGIARSPSSIRPIPTGNASCYHLKMCVADGVRRKFERNRFAAWIASPKAVVSAVALLSAWSNNDRSSNEQLATWERGGVARIPIKIASFLH